MNAITPYSFESASFPSQGKQNYDLDQLKKIEDRAFQQIESYRSMLQHYRDRVSNLPPVIENEASISERAELDEFIDFYETSLAKANEEFLRIVGFTRLKKFPRTSSPIASIDFSSTRNREVFADPSIHQNRNQPTPFPISATGSSSPSHLGVWDDPLIEDQWAEPTPPPISAASSSSPRNLEVLDNPLMEHHWAEPNPPPISADASSSSSKPQSSQPRGKKRKLGAPKKDGSNVKYGILNPSRDRASFFSVVRLAYPVGTPVSYHPIGGKRQDAEIVDHNENNQKIVISLNSTEETIETEMNRIFFVPDRGTQVFVRARRTNQTSTDYYYVLRRVIDHKFTESGNFLKIAIEDPANPNKQDDRQVGSLMGLFPATREISELMQIGEAKNKHGEPFKAYHFTYIKK